MTPAEHLCHLQQQIIANNNVLISLLNQYPHLVKEYAPKVAALIHDQKQKK